MKQALKGSEWVTIHTKDYADNSPFLSPFKEKLVYVLPPVEMPEPIPGQVAAWRRELLVEDNKLVGYAGRFVEEKGFDFLLKSIPYVVERIPEVKFVYAGEVNVVYESFFEKCRHWVDRWSDHVIMLGLLTDMQKVANFYAMCDVLALPSRTDCFPMVQAEAMLCGTPAVATDIPGLRVPVRTTGMGRLVRPQDERALAEGLVDVLTNRERYVRSREEIRAIFDLEKTVDVYEGLFESLIYRVLRQAPNSNDPSQTVVIRVRSSGGQSLHRNHCGCGLVHVGSARRVIRNKRCRFEVEKTCCMGNTGSCCNRSGHCRSKAPLAA